MSTQCTPTQLEFHAFGRRQIVGRFDAGRLTSDGGAILLREVDRRLALMRRVAGCFTDYRDPNKVEHSVLELVTQRVGGIALGYEDLNDHDVLRGDSLLALWAGKADLTGAKRSRERDRGYSKRNSFPERKPRPKTVSPATSETMTESWTVTGPGLQPFKARQPLAVSDGGDEANDGRRARAFQNRIGQIEVVQKEARKQGQVESDGDDVRHDENDIPEELEFTGAPVQFSVGEPRLHMLDVEPDDVPDRIGQQDDAEDGERRENTDDACKKRRHDEEAASDNGR